QLRVRRVARASCIGEPVAAHRNQVAEHRARRRGTTGTATVEHQLPGRVGFHEYRVVGVADAGQRVAARQDRGVHADPDRVTTGVVRTALGDREQLHDTV